ncbi:hypothetical protein [uncultured Tenacibaculum sp.]|uniref:hypothetical protein n=1 Tax=uncultured Tenacibaculum sp. TaxID=174713 RepID=UPI0026296942|nr:hypothetical protein [uncultured Tenacibaculum sp.]
MGAWNTMHVFSNEIFYNEVVPKLRGEKGCIKEDFIEFYASHKTGGIIHMSPEELDKEVSLIVKGIHNISNQLDKTFKVHEVFNFIEDWNEQEKYLNAIEFIYDFGKFLEYYIFKYCADFSPYVICGKRGIRTVINYKANSVTEEVLNVLENYDTIFCYDGMGIVNWISNEETALFSMFQEDLIREHLNKEDEEYYNEIEQFLKFVVENNLSLIRGQDMREWNLVKLPQYKLISENKWKTLKENEILNFRY